MERRHHPRFRTRFDVLCSDGATEGAGTLVDISRCGAQIESATPAPKLGSQVRLYVFIQPVCPFELSGEVVRVDAEGFAIEYGNLDREVGRLVDDIAGLVC